MGEVHTGNAADTLDRIREGGGKLILTAQQRLGEVKRALDHGRFVEAFTVGNSLQEKLGHLAAAENALARVADTSIIRARDLEPGMVVLDGGKLSEVNPCSQCERPECEHLTLTFESGHAVSVDRGDEVAVSLPAD